MSVLYELGRQGILDGTIPAWPSGTWKAMLVTANYEPNMQFDEFVTAVPPTAIVARTPTLTSLSAADGVARAANVTLDNVSGPAINYVVVYEDTGSDATSRLIALIDSANGLPLTPNGGQVTIAWDSGPNGIFKI